ncbi:MAG: SxtJ family membrane protein [Gammaproteobacteria bacterium]
MAHERLSAHHEQPIKGSSNRSFGLIFAAFFCIIALLPLFSRGELRPWALMVAAVFVVIAIAVPSVLTPLNRAWMRLGLLLHRVVNPVVLGLMFLVAIVPIGLLMRLIGKDLLRLKFSKDASSYWIVREPKGPDPRSLNRQF